MMLEIANRRAFLAHRSSIECKFHLNQQLTQQNNLLDACIPRHLCARVKHDLSSALKEWRARRSYPCKPFNELYIEKHAEVTILFADLVNSMQLAAKLNANQLVMTLDRLYRRFDLVAQFNRCTRIKLLGDCYYCVCGLPNRVPNHAWHSVSTGLAMLDIIRDVREKAGVQVDMRIGKKN